MQSRISLAKPEHLIALIERVRDVELVAFSQYDSCEHALMQSLSRSVVAWTGFFDNRPVAVWGLIASSIFSEEAYVWMLGSRDIEEHPFIFARHSNEALNLSLQYFSKLTGVVKDDFECGIRWLEWLGFSIGESDGFVRKFEWIR